MCVSSAVKPFSPSSPSPDPSAALRVTVCTVEGEGFKQRAINSALFARPFDFLSEPAPHLVRGETVNARG